jgi:hypothetical protein
MTAFDVVAEAEVVDETSLPALASAANRWHGEVVNAHRGMIQAAVLSGAALLKAKDLCKHGTFTAWVKTNFDGSHSLANKYMRLARNSERVTNLDPDTSLREALHAIDYLARPPEPQNPSGGWSKGQPCLWGGGSRSDPMGKSILLPLQPNTAAAMPEQSEQDALAWTAMMANAWKTRLRKAADDADRSIGQLVAVAHEKHQPGSPDADAKTQARLALNISKWVDALAAVRTATSPGNGAPITHHITNPAVPGQLPREDDTK